MRLVASRRVGVVGVRCVGDFRESSLGLCCFLVESLENVLNVDEGNSHFRFELRHALNEFLDLVEEVVRA